MKKNLKKKRKLLSIAKDCEVEVSLQEDGFKGSWFRAILEQNPTRVKGKKLRVCYKTLFNEDGVNPCKETIERCFIRPVPPECVNEGVIFKEGSVVDAYFNNGWWTGLIVVERLDGSFLVYFDDPPDIMRFIRSQLRPHADWIGSEWIKSKNKLLSQHMFRTGKPSPPRDLCAEYSLNDYVEVVVTHGWRKDCEVEVSLQEDGFKGSWFRAILEQNPTRVRGKKASVERPDGSFLVYFDDPPDIMIFIRSQLRPHADWIGSEWVKSKNKSSPPQDLCAEYSLNDYVEVVVTHGWRKGRVTEILLENNYRVYFAATKEDAIFNYIEIMLSMEWLGGGSWIKAHEVFSHT
ncbi:hypothetical protein F2Q68_00011008 [Brassica cretica]|uniref:Agenet domain-containing protein n=1 Tax=Brassica cretica TaxID=69181 RepID=A0A8S9KRD7_BRACR|nr:hypothetical protein F2Q68_00011008 [Brassica cretica]